MDLDGSTANELGAPEATTTTSDPALTPRGWFKSDRERTVAKGLEEALQTLKDVLLRDRYVVSLGTCLVMQKDQISTLCRAFLASGGFQENNLVRF